MNDPLVCYSQVLCRGWGEGARVVMRLNMSHLSISPDEKGQTTLDAMIMDG